MSGILVEIVLPFIYLPIMKLKERYSSLAILISPIGFYE